ncbi:hypothetical protein [Paragemmobacter straminiformis]|uniref:Uncharacterized protein n=1 Tax=Paragemmobacter straminiformis TaxID=2045119 RepID=A0A842IGL9_9RHOB|nr:hypothetical protein [Gemmobacter straminiformis]MBC2837598.1 hypothetical protein [Gemmobacter straminiformis]
MTLRHTLPRLDPAPLKDMARSLRFVAERGGKTLKSALPLDVLPDPAARVADAALDAVLKVGQGAERGVTALAHALLDRDEAPPTLSRPEDAEAEARFATAAHDGLRAALAHLGAESALVSEMAARRAWQAVTGAGSGQEDTATAAALFLGLIATHCLREAIWPETFALPAAEAARIATFAVLLSMLSDAAGFRALLPAAVDITLALRADLAAAGEDPALLAALFDEFRNHV